MKQLGTKVTSFLKTEIRRLKTGDATVPSARDGDMARDERDWDAAITHYTRYLERRPGDAGIMVQLGHALKESGRHHAAKTIYTRAATLLPDDPDIFLQMGHLAKLMGDRPAMLANYGRAFDLDPALTDPYNELIDNAPRDFRAWAESGRSRPPTSPHNFQPPVEPKVRADSPAQYATVDSARAALDTKRIVRATRKAPLVKPLTVIEQDYAMAKFGVFNSTYNRAGDVLTALAGLSGLRPDQSVDALTVFGLGASPALRLPSEIPSQPHLLLQRYSDMQVAASERMRLRPELKGSVPGGDLISILMPVYRGPAVYVERAILSVLMQTYGKVQLCIVDDCSQRADITALLSYYAAQDSRVSLVVHETNRGIAEATNTALQSARGAYIALLDHDDMIAHDAIEQVMAELQKNPGIDWLYTDECKIDGDDIADEIFNKPDWSPTLLACVMYTGHLSVYRKSIVEQVGSFRSQFDFSQDYDLALRVAEASPHVVHLAECLYGWRMIEGSASQGGKPMARMTNVAALQDAANRRQLQGRAVGLPYSNRLRRDRSAKPPLVSLIIPSDNVSNITTTIASILLTTSYPNIQIVVVTNSSCAEFCRAETMPQPIHYVDYDGVYNFSDKCNKGADAAKGEYLIFFNDDVRVTDPEWLDVVLETLVLPEVGIVGPKLVYENESIQHGGMVTGVRNLVGTAFHSFPEATPAYFGFAQTAREVSLICGACLAIKAKIFKVVGGFDSVNVPIAHSDVDLCFKVREAGFSCVYTPHTKLTHIGHLSIAATKKIKKKIVTRDKADIFLLKRWGEYITYDPYFPPGMRDILFIDSIQPYYVHLAERHIRSAGKDIMIVSHDLSGSGAPKVAFDIAMFLLAEGNYVLVVSPEDGPFRDRLIKAGADVIIDALCLSPGNTEFRNLAKNFDAVVANTIVTWPIVNQLASLTKVLWYVHETELVGHLARTHPTLGEGASDAIVWAGSRLAATALKEIAIPSTVVEYGVVPSKAASDLSTDGKVIVSILATYEPRKGQDLALLAIKALPTRVRELCEFRFAGRVNDSEFFDAIKEIGENDADIRHLGVLTFEEYNINLADSHIILCPSRDDTLPLVSLDALANGKILVCTSTTGTSAYIKNNMSGYIAKTASPQQIAKSLEEALNTKSSWPVISANARKVFTQNFTLERFHDRLKGFFLGEASRGLTQKTDVSA